LSQAVDLTGHWAGYLTIALFIVAYALVVTEEFTRLRKSKPVVVAAGLIWLAIAIARPEDPAVLHAFEESLTEYAELLLFLLVAMTYVNAMTERNVFGALRDRLIRSRAGYRTLFWSTGALTFMLSAWIDNLTATLVMSGVVLAIVREARHVTLYCINIVVAANAGGAWSPFGDITTLMVWQAGKLHFFDFFQLFPASVVSWLVPALIMHFRLPPGGPETAAGAVNGIRRGGVIVILLFVATLATAISFHSLLGLPPVLGMMTGLGYLQVHGFFLMRAGVNHDQGYADGVVGDVAPFDMFRYVARAEWDTLLFFYGIILCVGGLGVIGYLAALSSTLYGTLGATWANVLIGAASAVIDNIPIMAAVLEMDPDMGDSQWLLITFTAGVGGSMLAIGSAAGVALMGQARGAYTFFGHLRWTPAIAIGYAAGIVAHLALFT
jgi:Na+/H+ antiporter NhaD/arsenite permease-like protein